MAVRALFGEDVNAAQDACRDRSVVPESAQVVDVCLSGIHGWSPKIILICRDHQSRAKAVLAFIRPLALANLHLYSIATVLL